MSLAITCNAPPPPPPPPPPAWLLRMPLAAGAKVNTRSDIFMQGQAGAATDSECGLVVVARGKEWENIRLYSSLLRASLNFRVQVCRVSIARAWGDPVRVGRQAPGLAPRPRMSKDPKHHQPPTLPPN